MNARSTKVVRCAIYTRVSTEQGLEQDFNSLDAQYDASQAYIRSQAHAGWSLLRAPTAIIAVAIMAGSMSR
jgi:site-specific DNA recombinase